MTGSFWQTVVYGFAFGLGFAVARGVLSWLAEVIKR